MWGHGRGLQLLCGGMGMGVGFCVLCGRVGGGGWVGGWCMCVDLVRCLGDKGQNLVHHLIPQLGEREFVCACARPLIQS